MANRKITGDQILDKSASEVWKEYTAEVEKGKVAMQEILKTALEFKKISGGFSNVKNETDFTAVQERKAKAINEGTIALKENERVNKRLMTLQQRLQVVEASKNREIVKTSTAINQQNAKLRKTEKASSAINKTYQLLILRYQKLNKLAQEAGAKFGTQSKEFKKASASALAYRAKLDNIDLTLKNAQRNVGRYNLALGNSYKLMRNLAGALGVTAGITAFVSIMRNAAKVTAEFEQQLVAVGKTSNIAGDELKDFGNKAIDLVTGKLSKLSLEKILQLSETAGQLGVQGSVNILRFAETLARLETATDLVGQEGAKQIARILNVTNESVENVDRLGAAIVDLGNNFDKPKIL